THCRSTLWCFVRRTFAFRTTTPTQVMSRLLSSGLRAVLGVSVVVALAACGDRSPMSRSVVIDFNGGTVEGPDGVSLTIPSGAIPQGEKVSVSISRVDVAQDPGLGLDHLCGSAYMVSPANAKFTNPASISLPDTKCENGALLYAAPGLNTWAAVSSEPMGKSRAGTIPGGGIVAIGPVTVSPAADTTVYIGSAIDFSVTDWFGRPINHAWMWSKTLNKDLIAPDDEYAGGKQRAKREGVAGLTLSVPAAGFEKTIEVRILPNPARQVRVIRGREQATKPYLPVSDSILVEVLAEGGTPVPNVWVDFVIDGERRLILGGGATDELGRVGLRPRGPGQVG